MADTVQGAIEEAKKELEAKIAKDGGTPPPADNAEAAEVEVEVEPEADEEETISDEESDLSESELDESKRLYKALKDPKSSGAIIAALAAQAGLHLTADSTKAEVKEAKRDLTAVVKEALGPEYEFLAAKLGKAIDGALEIEREQNEASLQQIRQAQVEREVSDSYAKLARETKGESKKLEARMAALSEEIPIGNMSVEQYIRRLHMVASGEATKHADAAKTASQIRKNAGNAPERLRTTRPVGAEPKLPTEKLGLKGAVNFALNELTKGKN